MEQKDHRYTMPVEWWDKEIDVLDKIRDEIQHLSRADNKYNKVWMSDVLVIIDKYKAERSE